jgi:hypothetical protein
MIGRLALRSLTAHPVRSAVLAAGFGAGVAVMAILLGVAAIVLEQAQSPALVGGGDVHIRLSPAVPAKLVLSGTLQADALRRRIRAAAASHTADLFLLHGGKAIQVAARGGIPSVERDLGDPEVSAMGTWRDTREDAAWAHESPENVLRQIDRFHDVPDVPEWSDSWAEWLYFNGRSREARFYLTFMVGPRATSGARRAGVRLQIERNGHVQSYSTSAEVNDTEAARAPDLAIGGSSVRLDGLVYRIHLDLADAAGRRTTGDFTLAASAGRLVPPIEISGARGWRTGYVVPVMSGAVDGTLVVAGETVSLAGGAGYHDHNWGFWKGVSWQWGQALQGDLSLIYGRVFPPADAADPKRIPGFVGALGPDGPLGYATDVRIAEINDDQGRPRTITVRAHSSSLTLDLQFEVMSSVTTPSTQGALTRDMDFIQMRGQYTVSARTSSRDIAFTAPGSAETFRGK